MTLTCDSMSALTLLRGPAATRRTFQVLPLVLSSEIGGVAVAEPLPTLVDTQTWIPLRLATRWAVRHLRWTCMPATIADSLRSLGLVYAWSDRELGHDLDDFIEKGATLSATQIEALIAFLRTRVGAAEAARLSPGAVPTMATLGKVAAPVKRFLACAADPQLRGGSGVIPIEELTLYHRRLDLLFGTVIKRRGRGKRIEPLDAEQDERLRLLISPVQDESGRTRLPLRFRPDNPFDSTTRLRNWLMYQIARECGLRRGEILKLYISDITSAPEPHLAVRRRPNDRADTRRSRPFVKRGEHVLPISDLLRAGLRAYQTTRHPIGRMGVGSPYLIVSDERNPLSLTSTRNVLSVAGKAKGGAGISRLTWHALRHTWAEEIAEDLLREHGDEGKALDVLRELGGWSPRSDVPAHYIRNAIRNAGHRYLRERNRSLWKTADSGEAT